MNNINNSFLQSHLLNLWAQFQKQCNRITILNKEHPLVQVAIKISGVFVAVISGFLLIKVACFLKEKMFSSPKEDKTNYIEQLPLEMMLYIGTFLSPKQQLEASFVSSKFREVMTHDALWSKNLSDPEHRVWGAVMWNCERNQETHTYQFVDNQDEGGGGEKINSFKSFLAYQKLPNEPVLKYLGRLLPGGPIAYNEYPTIKFLSPDWSTLEINSSFLKGQDSLNNYFFALRIMKPEDNEPVALIFRQVKNAHGFLKWKQEANKYWTQDELNLEENDTLNYVLALLRRESRESLERFKAPFLYKSIQLI
jgi:hypothetical protein